MTRINDRLHNIDKKKKARKLKKESPYWRQITGMEKKVFIQAVKNERDQMMLLGSFSLPKLSSYNKGQVASNSTGLRRSGFIAWHEISLFGWLQRMN